jgi:uncharacterized protein involved in exopolysaccharide biosynthesis
MTQQVAGPNDSLDLREVGAALWRGKAWFVAFATIGTLFGVLTTSMIRPRYDATASVMVRSESGSGGLSLGRLPFDVGSVLGGGSILETELEVFTSRSLMGEVVDSLLLNVDVLEPRATAPLRLAEAASFPDLTSSLTLEAQREGDGFRLRGEGVDAVVQPGVPATLAGGTLVLRAGGLPDAFTLRIDSRDDAIRAAQRRLRSRQVGNEVARLTFRAGDPATAADGLNLLLDRYIERRRTTDRGVNQHRSEFLTVQVDSIGAALADAEGRLRAYQESSGVLLPALSAQNELARATELRAELEAVEVEARALGEIASGRAPLPRELAAFPTLLQNAAVNGLHSRLLDLEAKRSDLLERRTEADPDIVLLSSRIRETEGELVTLASAYLGGLTRQQREMRQELRRYDAVLNSLPEQSERILGLQREVTRLSETLVLLQSQIVQTRVAAIGEGGIVRPIDRAVRPLRPAFPIGVVNVGLGMFGGAFFGLLCAFVAGRSRPIVNRPWEAELAAAAPAVRLQPGGPLLLGLIDRSRTILVLPVGTEARPRAVAERLASTGALQGHRVVLADLTGGRNAGALTLPGAPAGGTAVQVAGHMEVVPGSSRAEDAFSAWSPNGETAPLALRSAVGDLQDQFDVTIVVLPGLHSSATVALLGAERPIVLAAHAGRTTSHELQTVAGTLTQQGIPVAAVVLHDRDGRARSG